MAEDRIVAPEANSSDQNSDVVDGAIRPLRFDDFIGQRAVCENLKIFIGLMIVFDSSLEYGL